MILILPILCCTSFFKCTKWPPRASGSLRNVQNILLIITLVVYTQKHGRFHPREIMHYHTWPLKLITHVLTSRKMIDVPLHYIVLLVWMEISMEIISMGHTNILDNIKLSWVQDPKFSSKSSWRLPTNTLNIKYKTKVEQKIIITQVDLLENIKKTEKKTINLTLIVCLLCIEKYCGPQ